MFDCKRRCYIFTGYLFTGSAKRSSETTCPGPGACGHPRLAVQVQQEVWRHSRPAQSRVQKFLHSNGLTHGLPHRPWIVGTQKFSVAARYLFDRRQILSTYTCSGHMPGSGY